MDMKTLTLEELYAKSKNLSKDELILDVRQPEEYAEGHVPGSRNTRVGSFDSMPAPVCSINSIRKARNRFRSPAVVSPNGSIRKYT